MSEEAARVRQGLTTEGTVGPRYLAHVIDVILLSAVLIAVLATRRSLLQTSNIASRLVVIYTTWIGYFAILESSRWQATLGKKIGAAAKSSKRTEGAPLGKLTSVTVRKQGDNRESRSETIRDSCVNAPHEFRSHHSRRISILDRSVPQQVLSHHADFGRFPE
jgi:hypothetical protein